MNTFSEDFPKIVEFLGQYEQFFIYLDAVNETRESMIRNLENVPDDYLARASGKICALTEILDLGNYDSLKDRFQKK